MKLISLALLVLIFAGLIFAGVGMKATIGFVATIVWPLAVSIAAILLVHSVFTRLINYFDEKSDACEAQASFFRPAKKTIWARGKFGRASQSRASF